MQPETPAPAAWPPGDGEMAARIRAHEWSATPLGAIATWQPRFRAMVEHVLASPLVSSVVCGRADLVLIYNDAAARLYGDRHPAALGSRLPESFPEGWATVAPLYARVFQGESVQVEAMPLDTRGEGVSESGGEGGGESGGEGGGEAGPDVFDAVLVPARDQAGQVAWAHMSGVMVGARVRAEAALRDSESRFRQFAEASSDALWIRAADTLAMEYASPAFEALYGVDRQAVMGGGDPRRWTALILPEDRDAALQHLEQARLGRAVVHEFRIRRPSDAACRWIRDKGFPLRDEQGRVRRIGGIATDVTDARQSAEHQAALLAELQHRVRNTMAVIRAIVARTARTAASVDDYAASLGGRLMTLARVQAQLTRAANAGAEVAGIVRAELDAQPGPEDRHELAGPDVVLSPKAAEVFALAVHELASNAHKHGALGDARAHVGALWRTERRAGGTWLLFDWREHTPPDWAPSHQGDPGRVDPGRVDPGRVDPGRRGFGSELIEDRIPYELGGRVELRLDPEGARCHIEFPLGHAPSILETGAPQMAAFQSGGLGRTAQGVDATPVEPAAPVVVSRAARNRS